MQHPIEPTPDHNTSAVSESGTEDIATAFELGTEIERERSHRETLAILRRIADRLDNAREHERRAYASGYADALDGREPEYTAGPGHDARRFGHGHGGHDIRCACGWRTQLHRTELQATVEWREHAGEPPIRPDLHPMWCDEIHEQEACDVHVGSVGVLTIADDTHVTTLLANAGPDGGLVATVTVVGKVGDVSHDIPLDPAPKPGRRRRKQHAFTVERTQGDHFVWTCKCGFVHVQDPRDTDTQQTLTEHATGEPR